MHILNMLRKRISVSLTGIVLFVILCGVKCLFVRKIVLRTWRIEPEELGEATTISHFAFLISHFSHQKIPLSTRERRDF